MDATVRPSWRQRILIRLGRLRPAHVLPAPRILVFLTWVAIAGLGALLVIPGALLSETGTPAAWVRVVVYVGIGALVAVWLARALMAASLDERNVTVRFALTFIAFLAIESLPALWLLGLRDVLLAIVTWITAVAIVAVAIGVRRTRAQGSSRAIVVTVVAVASAIPWVIAAARTSIESAELLWIPLSAIAGFLAFVAAYYAIVAASQSRASAIGTTFRSPTAKVTGIALGVVALGYASLMTWAQLFDSGSQAHWKVRDWTSIPAVLLVAGLIVWFWFRSERRPFRPTGWRVVVLGIIAFSTATVSLLAVLGIALLLNGAFGSAIDVPLWLVDVFEPASSIGVVLLLLPFIVLPHFARSAGRAVAVVSLAYLAPGLSSLYAVALVPDVPTYWAAPASVVLALWLAAAALFVLKVVGRLEAISWAGILRLTIVPFVAINAVVALPDVIETGFAPLLLLLGVVAAFAFFMPPVAASRWRHSVVVLGASAAGLFAVVIAILSLSSSGLLEGTATSALLYLAVPMIAALCVRQSGADQAGSTRTVHSMAGVRSIASSESPQFGYLARRESSTDD